MATGQRNGRIPREKRMGEALRTATLLSPFGRIEIVKKEGGKKGHTGLRAGKFANV